MAYLEEIAFFDRIRDEPDDDGPRLIYADWLAENGPAERGEFIRIQCALEHMTQDDPATAKLRERERSLLEQHEAAWSEPLQALVGATAFHRGIIDRVSMLPEQFIAGARTIFKLAPVRQVRFINVGDQFAELMKCPELSRLREIDLSGNLLGHRGATRLASSAYLEKLDGLDLSFTELGDFGLTALANGEFFKNLRSLRIHDNPHLSVVGLERLAISTCLPALRDLDLSGNSLDAHALRRFLQSPLGKQLTRLVLVGNRLGDAGTIMFAASPVFAHMAEHDRRIDLRRVEMGAAGARALADLPAMAHVETLDLEGNFLGDAGLSALAASPNLTRLRTLSVRENRISDEGIRALARSPILETLRELDLTGNLITQDSADRLHEGSVGYDWRGLLQLKVDSKLRTRPFGAGPLGAYFRRPLPE